MAVWIRIRIRNLGALSKLASGSGKRAGPSMKSGRGHPEGDGTARIQRDQPGMGWGPCQERESVSRKQPQAGREGEATSGTRTGIAGQSRAKPTGDATGAKPNGWGPEAGGRGARPGRGLGSGLDRGRAARGEVRFRPRGWIETNQGAVTCIGLVIEHLRGATELREGAVRIADSRSGGIEAEAGAAISGS